MACRSSSGPALAAVFLSAGLMICAAGAAAPASPDATILINVKEFMFAPMSLTVKTGATVTWTNLDQEPHTIVSDSGLFRSAALDTNERFSFTFEKPGIYRYLCTIHPRMTGSIVVE